jgi:1-acyl-sn-glycerol-3-phosphate acyltransferase
MPQDRLAVTELPLGTPGAQPLRLTSRAVLSRPLPHAHGHLARRLMLRLVGSLSCRWLLEVRGAERIDPRHDPFILALNHSQRPEAVVVPTLLILLRAGRLLRFFADWNFLLVPGVGRVLRIGEVLTLTHKHARPRALDALKRFYRPAVPAFTQARRLLAAGESVGIFPEGTVNRDPRRLLPGRLGAARLSLQSGRPLLPAGLRFPLAPPDRPIGDGARFTLEIGEPLVPPPTAPGGRPSRDVVVAWHGRLMQELSKLSGKQWSPPRGAPQEELEDA